MLGGGAHKQAPGVRAGRGKGRELLRKRQRTCTQPQTRQQRRASSSEGAARLECRRTWRARTLDSQARFGDKGDVKAHRGLACPLTAMAGSPPWAGGPCLNILSGKITQQVCGEQEVRLRAQARQQPTAILHDSKDGGRGTDRNHFPVVSQINSILTMRYLASTGSADSTSE